MNFEGKTILLIDDDDSYLTMTKMALESYGLAVITNCNPNEGLEYLKNNSVDVVLLDYFMPELTGDEFVKRLREFKNNQIVVLQTGYADENTPIGLMKQSDVQGYFDKTSGIDNLVVLLISIFRVIDKVK